MTDRLKKLADALSVPNGSVIRTDDIEAAAAILRAASAETLGTEWTQHSRPFISNERYDHNADIAAARVAIAEAKAERDRARLERDDNAAAYLKCQDALDAALARVAKLESDWDRLARTDSPAEAKADETLRELVAKDMLPHLYNKMCDGRNRGQFGWPEDWVSGLVGDAFKMADAFVLAARKAGGA